MKAQVLLSLILAGSMFAVSANAEEQSANTSSVKVSDVKKSDEKKEDIDQEITNARMRATLGSKSAFSFKSSLGYNGGSLEKPLDSIRPNYRASASIESLTALSGNVGMNYRVSKGGNLSLGTGVLIMAPLEGDITKDFKDPRASQAGKNQKRSQVSDPYVDYSHGYRALGMQMISSATYTHYTTEDATDYYKLLGNVSLSQIFLADLGTSKWQAGASISYDKDLENGDFAGARYDYGIGLFPFAEYSINDRFSFRTVFGYFQFAKYSTMDLVQLEPYQSMGIGISLTRDIYLYPNVQFTPKDIRSDRTNVALSANLNLF